MRDHAVSDLTARELERARRDLAANLALVRPDSPARVPILAHISAIDTELAQRTAGRPEQLPDAGHPRVRRDHMASLPLPRTLPGSPASCTTTSGGRSSGTNATASGAPPKTTPTPTCTPRVATRTRSSATSPRTPSARPASRKAKHRRSPATAQGTMTVSATVVVCPAVTVTDKGEKGFRPWRSVAAGAGGSGQPHRQPPGPPGPGGTVEHARQARVTRRAPAVAGEPPGA